MDVFGKIIVGEIPTKLIYEDKCAIVILDISKITFGHTLIIPKDCYETIFDLPNKLWIHLTTVTKKIARAIKDVTGCLGLNIISNNGPISGQEVPRFHIHLIPRYSEEEFKYQFTSHQITDEDDKLIQDLRLQIKKYRGSSDKA